MARERTWIDYANLGSNIAQNLQLRRANQTLEGLERAATVRAVGEQQNRLADENEARLREHVFQLAEDIEGLQRHLHELPCAALALGIQIKGVLAKNNVTTASFREWADKDRLKQLLNGLDDVCDKSAARLTESQRRDAEKCAKYLAEVDALDQLISIQHEKEKFQHERERLEKSLDIDGKRLEIAKLRSEQSGIHSPTWANVCSAVGALGVVFCAFWFVVYVASASMSDPSEDAAPQQSLPAFILLSAPGGEVFAVFLVSVVAIVATFLAPANRRHAELAGKIISLNAKIASAEADLSQFDSASVSLGDHLQTQATQTRLEELYAMFGHDLTSEAYTQMKRMREMFINKVFAKPDAAAIVV